MSGDSRAAMRETRQWHEVTETGVFRLEPRPGSASVPAHGVRFPLRGQPNASCCRKERKIGDGAGCKMPSVALGLVLLLVSRLKDNGPHPSIRPPQAAICRNLVLCRRDETSVNRSEHGERCQGSTQAQDRQGSSGAQTPLSTGRRTLRFLKTALLRRGYCGLRIGQRRIRHAL